MTDWPSIFRLIENDAGDLEWFAAHPGREYRARLMTAAELARKKDYPGDGDGLEDDRFGYALVRLMPPGHVVIFYIGVAAPKTEPDEANIARLWKNAFEEAAAGIQSSAAIAAGRSDLIGIVGPRDNE